MYKYEIKPTLCAQLVVRNTHNLGELCITISGYKDEPYVDTIISEDIMHDFLGEDNFKTMMSSNGLLGFTYSYECIPFMCTGFKMVPPMLTKSLFHLCIITYAHIQQYYKLMTSYSL